ncbi:unnamed protein product [Arabis nemorensis]|uniref:Uncharacterized protein n=1 Tax=Arabis nemorensis TaxID=586526 RepID=A0A565C4C4_9BRAS|nr:unnamed protein product [Arabis nemorensis]
MEHMIPLPGIYNLDFIATNQGSRANSVIKGTKKEQVDQIIKDMREFKEKNKVDKLVVLWRANTERYSNVIVGLNDTMENLLASVEKNESEISPSTLSPLLVFLKASLSLIGVLRILLFQAYRIGYIEELFDRWG